MKCTRNAYTTCTTSRNRSPKVTLSWKSNVTKTKRFPPKTPSTISFNHFWFYHFPFFLLLRIRFAALSLSLSPSHSLCRFRPVFSLQILYFFSLFLFVSFVPYAVAVVHFWRDACFDFIVFSDVNVCALYFDKNRFLCTTKSNWIVKTKEKQKQRNTKEKNIRSSCVDSAKSQDTNVPPEKVVTQ